jgi:hypothetical protein
MTCSLLLLSRSRPPLPPTPPPRKNVVEVDWCHFFQDFHDPEYCYSYTHHLELSKSCKAPLPPINNKLTSTSQNDHVNMEYYVPHDDNSPPFGRFVVETRIHASKPNLQGVEGAPGDPRLPLTDLTYDQMGLAYDMGLRIEMWTPGANDRSIIQLETVVLEKPWSYGCGHMTKGMGHNFIGWYGVTGQGG